MNKICLFCEGVTDQVFIADFLEIHYDITLNRKYNKRKAKIEIYNELIEIISVDGVSKLSNKIYTDKIEENTLEGILNIVILDADKSGFGNNGFNACRQKLEDLSSEYDFKYYIWPNNCDNGEIENLLIELIPTDKQQIIDCIDQHIVCLKSLPILDIRTATLKEKLNFYLYTCNCTTKDRDYKNSTYWNLDLETNKNLKRFKEFCDTFIKA